MNARMQVEPTLHYVFPIARPVSERGRWSRTDDYFVWTDRRTASESPLAIWEMRLQGALRIPDTDVYMHVISGGTPHHIEHLFGYWRVCDTDVVAFRSVQPDGVYYSLILGGCPGAYNRDAIQWICPRCAHTLAHEEFATGRTGWDRFWTEEARLVARFNASAAARTCPKCGHLHPHAYRFDPTGDNADEAAARAYW